MTAGGIALVTIAHGRHDHLAALLAGAARSIITPDQISVCAMADDHVRHVVRNGWDGKSTVCEVARVGEELPLARARNTAAQAAIDRGARTLVFLDVDCIPSATLIGRYSQILTTAPADAPLIAAGEVRYLPRQRSAYALDRLDDLGRPHPARPVLADGEVRGAANLDLFWSLSFAMTAEHWCDAGGFDERYVGYGGEDTDFGRRVQARGGSMTWVGGARAFHQHHDGASPPVQHVGAIVRNAQLFHRTWGDWPMSGWLREFDRMGLVRFDGDELRLR